MIFASYCTFRQIVQAIVCIQERVAQCENDTHEPPLGSIYYSGIEGARQEEMFTALPAALPRVAKHLKSRNAIGR